MRVSRWLVAVGALVLGTSSAVAQRFVLQIKPRVGDTLRMRLDQQTEMIGVKHAGPNQSTASVVNTMQMFSRAIVEGVSAKGTTLLAVTDSVLLSTSNDWGRTPAARAQKELTGQHVRFQVASDGSVSMGDDDHPPREVAEAVSLMPAAFPKEPVSVGESWIREMMLPADTRLGAPASTKLRVTFRFDSVARSGDLAYVSMRGEMQPATGVGAAASTLDQGSVNGTILVDRRRGWLTESRFNIVVSSTVKSPATGMAAMHMHLKITQHMQTLARR